jgi:acetyl esterase
MRDAPVAVSREAVWSWVPYMGPQIPVRSVVDRFIPSRTAEIPVRIYVPDVQRRPDDALPAIVAFHGGCWIVGNIDLSDRPHRALAQATGCVVVAVNYQKAPEHRFPVPLDDCYAGYRWVVDNAASLGIDAARIAVAGDSAGGNLAAAVCLMARARNEEQPAAQVLIYPAVDPELATESARAFAEGFGLSTADMRWSWEQYVADEAQLLDPLVAPARADSLAGLAPAVVVTAEYDILRDEGLEYARRLAEDGVPTTVLHYEGAIHGFLWMASAVDACTQMLNDVGGALDDVIGTC